MNDKRNLESSLVREAARGQWLGILEALCPELESLLIRPGRHGACPVHGGIDGFRLFQDVAVSGGGICNTCGAKPDGFALLMWLKDWDFPSALKSVAEILGGVAAEITPARRTITPRKKVMSDRRIRELLQTTWNQAIPWDRPAASLVRAYLRNRGVDSLRLPQQMPLRFHSALPYFDEDGRFLGQFPAMLALVSGSDGKPATIHRTYLGLDAHKARVPSPKKLMPHEDIRPVVGGAIRLGPASRCIGVAEGIETALAIHHATGMTVWATVSNTLMMRFQPPAGVEQIAIWSDHDLNGAGQRAADSLNGILDQRGMRSVVLTPPIVGMDWLDVWNRIGYSGFPILRDPCSVAA